MAFPDTGGTESVQDMIARLIAETDEFVSDVKVATKIGAEEVIAMADLWEDAILDALNKIAQAADEIGGIAPEFFDENMEHFDRLLVSIADNAPDVATGMEQIEQVTSHIIENMKELSPLNQVLNTVTESVGAFMQQFALPALVLGGLNAIRQFLVEGTQLAVEFSEVYRKFEIQVRQLQRTQGEAAGTTEEWLMFAEALSDEFGGSSSEVMQRMSLIISRLNDDMALNQEQMMSLIRAGEILDKTNIRQINSAEQLADFIQRGSVAALEALGLSYSEALFNQTAMEMGMDKTLDQMTEQEKQLVRLNIVLAQTNVLAADAASTQDTLAGRMENANKKIEEQKKAVGDILAPAWVWFKEQSAEALETVINLVQIWAVGTIALFSGVIAAFMGFAAAWQTGIDQIKSGTVDLTEIGRVFAESTTEVFEQLRREGVENMMGGLGQLGDVAEEEFGSMSANANSMAQNVTAAFNEVSMAIEDAMRRWEEGVADAQLKLQRKNFDIARNAQRRQRDLERDLQQDLSDMQRDAARKKQDAIRDAQDKEMRLREEFADDIKEIENKFLFDLEDAVRERDARRVLDLLRRMSNEKKKREKDFKDRQRELKRNLKQELDEIDENLKRQREKRLLAHQREMEDLRLATQRRLDDARMAYNRELQDLATNINRRLQLVAQGISEELNLNAQGLQALHTMLNDAYGPNGWVEAFFARYAEILASAGQIPSTNLPPSGAGFGGGIGTGGGGQNQPLAFARGTTGMLAMNDQFIRVGERPELVTVTPLGGGGQPLAGFARNFNQSGQVSIGLEVSMSDGLRGEIVDQSMDEFAEVLVNISNG